MSNLIANEIERNIAEDHIIKDIRSLFRLTKKKDNSDVDKIVRGIRFLFEPDKEDYQEPIRIGNAFSSNYIEC